MKEKTILYSLLYDPHGGEKKSKNNSLFEWKAIDYQVEDRFWSRSGLGVCRSEIVPLLSF